MVNMPAALRELEVLPSQIQAANPFLILVLIPIFSWWIYPSVEKVLPLTPLRKIGTGLFLMVLSFAVISLAQQAIDLGHTPSVWWQLLAYLIFTAAEILISIVCLEFAYTQAPRKMKSFVMSLFLLSVFAGNALTGIINTYIQIPELSLTTDKTHPGYDATADTNDDLTLMTNGEILSPALDQLKQSAAAIQYIYGIKKSLPTTASGAKALASINDPWGRPLRYTLISSSSARISSDGPDQIHKTAWDLGIILTVRQSITEEQGTWLSPPVSLVRFRYAISLKRIFSNSRRATGPVIHEALRLLGRLLELIGDRSRRSRGHMRCILRQHTTLVTWFVWPPLSTALCEIFIADIDTEHIVHRIDSNDITLFE